MRFLILNGPNLNWLGRRDVKIYGSQTLEDIEARLRAWGRAHDIGIDCRQSNHEGVLIDCIQEHHEADGLVINPGGLAHSSVALADAVRDFAKPSLEVHLSNLYRREPYRHHSYCSAAVSGVISGLGAQGYVLALDFLRSGQNSSS